MSTLFTVLGFRNNVFEGVIPKSEAETKDRSALKMAAPLKFT
jgi:hypothetical protein